MKNMKRMLRTLAVLSVVLEAGVNVTAYNETHSAKTLPIKNNCFKFNR